MKHTCSCDNPECDRPIERANQQLNMTQIRYCSLYCYKYVKQGLKKIRASDSKHHKNIWKFPAIATKCDNCGEEIELTYEQKKSNKSFCSRDCAKAARQLKGRRGLLRYQILRFLRDSDREWWSSADIAYILDQKNKIHALNGQKVSQHLRMYSDRNRKITLVESNGDKNARMYRFNPIYKNHPLVALMRGDFN